MTVYVDQEENTFRRMAMCHMFADTIEKLHSMATAIGLRRAWFQPFSFPHYDVAKGRRSPAPWRGGGYPQGGRANTPSSARVTCAYCRMAHGGGRLWLGAKISLAVCRNGAIVGRQTQGAAQMADKNRVVRQGQPYTLDNANRVVYPGDWTLLREAYWYDGSDKMEAHAKEIEADVYAAIARREAREARAHAATA